MNQIYSKGGFICEADQFSPCGFSVDPAILQQKESSKRKQNNQNRSIITDKLSQSISLQRKLKASYTGNANQSQQEKQNRNPFGNGYNFTMQGITKEQIQWINGINADIKTCFYTKEKIRSRQHRQKSKEKNKKIPVF